MKLRFYSPNAGTRRRTGGALPLYVGEGRISPAGLSLIIVLAVVICSVQAGPEPKGQIPVIRTKNKAVLLGPEDKPLDMPTDAAVGNDGVIYVLDGVNHRVVAYDAEGKLQFQFGRKGGGLGDLFFPLGIAGAPDGKVYIADSGNHRFQIFASDGTPLETVSLPVPASGPLPDPTDVVIDSVRQRLYVTDNDNHRLHVYNLTTGKFESVWGSPGQAQRQFRFPFLIDISSDGYVFVVEPINTRVQVLNPNGKFVKFVGAWGVQPGQLFRPKGVAVFGDKVFVTDSYLGTVQVFDLNGSLLGVLGDDKGVPMKFITPTGITADAKHNRLYVVELKANRVCRVDLE